MLARGLLALGLVVVLFWRPWAHGIPPVATALFWGFVLVHVALPGIAVAWATQRFRGDAILLVGQGCSLGLVVQALGYLGARALDIPAVASLTPLAVAGAALALCRGRRHLPEPAAPERGRSHLELLLLVLLLAGSLQPLVSERHVGSGISVDLLFHAGNAGEVRHRWPLEIPRIAGIPLKYQVLVYALPAGAASSCGLPVADVLLALCPLLWLLLLVIQVYNAGRALFGDGYVGLLGAGMLVLHVDPGKLLGLGGGAFNSYLATGLYGSPTTVCGFILLASLALTLSEWLSAAGRSWPALVPLALLSFAASAAKASVLPTVGGGLVALATWAWPRRRHLSGSALVALAVVVLSGAPVTLWLSTGEGSYHGMLRWGPGAAMKQSALAHWLARVTGAGSPPAAWLSVATLFPWLLGYLGLAGAGFMVWMAGRRPPLPPMQVWALGVAATGALLGLSLDAFGLSQLFFFYNGQVMLALFAGAGIVLALREGRQLSRIFLLGSGLPALLFAARGPLDAHREDRRVQARDWTEAEAQYAKGLAWLRANAAEDSVVLADNGSLYLSAFGECRMFYESGLYSPLGDIGGTASADRAYPERVDLQDRLLRGPGRENVKAVVDRFPAGTKVRIVADSVQTKLREGIEDADIAPIPSRRFFPSELFALEFANAAMHVYRVSPAARPGPDLPSNRATP